MGAVCCAHERKYGQNASFDSDHFCENLTFVMRAPLFSFLGRDELPRLALAFETTVICVGETVIEQGAVGSHLYVIKQGSAVATRTEGGSTTQLVDLARGDCFGEEAVLGAGPSAVTVRATDILQVLTLERSEFGRLGLGHKMRLGRQPAAAGGELGKDAAGPHLPRKAAGERAMLRRTLAESRGLKPIVGRVAPSELDAIVDRAFAVPFEAGHTIVAAGDAKADLLYMVEEGTVEVVSYGRAMQEFGPGGTFSGPALFHRAPWATAVRAATDGRLWAVPLRHLRQAGTEHLRGKLARYTRLLDQVAPLLHLSREQKRAVAGALLETTYYKDEYVAKEGDRGYPLFILQQGCAATELGGGQLSSASADPALGTFEVFGEQFLQADCCHGTSVRITSERAIVLTLDRATLETVLADAEAGAREVARRMSAIPRVSYSLDRLDEVGLLGTGAFGRVTLVRDRELGSTFALKAVSKGLLLHMQQLDAIRREKLVLQTTSCPFLVRLAATFITSQHVYFLLEAAIGGELFTLYRRRRFFGQEPLARFYTACTFRGLEHLHERGIIYRDMKPENLMLDARGYCKITDFGLATFAIGNTYTLCGTPEYMAPEIIGGMGYACAADWWALGVLAFECMTELSPFSGDSVVAIFHKVQGGLEPLFDLVPSSRSKSWCALVRGLCNVEPGERLPMRPGGIRNFMEQEWYESFNWKAHKSGAMTAPFVPDLQNGELSQFDTQEQDGPDFVRYSDYGSDWEDGFAEPWGPRLD